MRNVWCSATERVEGHAKGQAGGMLIAVGSESASPFEVWDLKCNDQPIRSCGAMI